MLLLYSNANGFVPRHLFLRHLSAQGWNKGSCLNNNKHPAPIGCIRYKSPLSCCEKAFCGQTSGVCVTSHPNSIKDTLQIEWYPIYSNQTCGVTYVAGNSNVGVRGYETQLHCCLSEFGHGTDTDPTECFAGLPNPPTTSPTPIGGLKLDFYYPDYSEFIVR